MFTAHIAADKGTLMAMYTKSLSMCVNTYYSVHCGITINLVQSIQVQLLIGNNEAKRYITLSIPSSVLPKALKSIIILWRTTSHLPSPLKVCNTTECGNRQLIMISTITSCYKRTLGVCHVYQNNSMLCQCSTRDRCSYGNDGEKASLSAPNCR